MVDGIYLMQENKGLYSYGGLDFVQKLCMYVLGLLIKLLPVVLGKA
jgi:hypothetical protein